METNKQLFDLLKNNKIDEFENLLMNDKMIDLNFRDESGNYLITYAVIMNNIKMVKLILSKNCRVDITDQEGRTLLYTPIKYRFDDILKLIIDYDKKNIGTPISNRKDKFGNIPLHYAVMFKYEYAIELLKDSNPNITDENGYNALHIAVYTKNLEMCKKIIDLDINVNARTKIGETAIHIACNFKLLDIVKLLVNNGANIDSQDLTDDITPFMYSVILSDNKTARYLFDKSIDQNLQDYVGDTALHHAIMENNIEMIDILIKSKTTNLNIFNINGKLPIHLFIESYTPELQKENSDYVKIYNILIDESNLNYQDSYGNTPLHLICMNNLWKNNNNLKKKKLNIYINNNNNKRPLDFINKNEEKQFMDIVVESYLYILRNYGGDWSNDWENICNKELFFNRLTKEELTIISKYTKVDTNNKIDICETLVRDKLNSFKSNKKVCDVSYPRKANGKCVNIDNNQNIDVCTFIGTSIDILMGLLYILQKYDYSCSTLTQNFTINNQLSDYLKTTDKRIQTRSDFLNFEIVWIYKKLFFSTNFTERFKHCVNSSGVRFIIVPLGIELSNGAHANYLLFDKKTFEIERFEPYGQGTPNRFNYDAHLLDSVLSFKFSEIDENIKYISPTKFLPKIGFQYLDAYDTKSKKIGDPGGFCALWSIWYVDMRLQYPDIDRKSLINKLIKNIKTTNTSFKNLIRNYSINITNTRDTIFNKTGMNINNWINNQYSDEQYDKIIIEINKMIEGLS